MSSLLGDRDGRLREMIRRRGPGRCEEVVRSASLRGSREKSINYLMF